MLRKLSLVFTAAALACGTVGAAPSDISVNGSVITSEQQEQMLQAAMAQGQERTSELEGEVRDRLIGQELLVQDALSKKLDRDPMVVNLIEQNRKGILASVNMNRYLKDHPVTEEEMKADYEARKARYGDTEYHVRHILVKTEPEALAALKRLAAGEDFAKVAEEISIDNGSRSSGGDLDWASPSSMVEPFANAMKTQKTGEISAKPVKTQFGYHILKVEATRPAELFPAFDHAKPAIRQELTQKKVFGYIESLRARAKIK